MQTMLAPETWAFHPPPSIFKVSEGKFDENADPLHNLIEIHHFNHLVSIVLPDTSLVPKSIDDALTVDSEYYKIKCLPVVELIRTEFIDAFVKKGQIVLLSLGTKIDLDDCIAITNEGYLVLSICLENYQKLGLEGRATKPKNREQERYVVSVDLAANHFVPGKKNYDRVHSCLSERLQQRFDVLLTWKPPSDDVCPSSIAAYFSERGFTTEVCKPQIDRRHECNVAVPNLFGQSDLQQFFEWLGIISLGLNCNQQDEFISSYIPPEDTLPCDQVAIITWSGFFSSKQIKTLFEELRAHVRGRTIPWTSFHVQGFSDSPVNWGADNHSFYTDGDNSYTIAFQPDGRFVVAKLKSNHRIAR